MATAIEIKDLSKSYAGRRNSLQNAINGVNLSIETGQLIGLIGRAGAGKTTLLRLIAGLDEPDSGTIEISELHQPIGAVNPFQPIHLVRQQEMVSDPEFLPASPVVLIDNSWNDEILAMPSSFVAWAKRAVNREHRTVIIASRSIQQEWQLYDRLVLLKKGSVVADLRMDDSPGATRPHVYRIRLKGALGKHWEEWFPGCRIAADQGETMLTGEMADQAALHGLLMRIRDLGLPIISVNRIYPELEKALEKLSDYH